jgi:hypothetical protein
MLRACEGVFGNIGGLSAIMKCITIYLSIYNQNKGMPEWPRRGGVQKHRGEFVPPRGREGGSM